MTSIVAEHIEKAAGYKNTGNDLLKEGKLKPASFQYKQGLMFVTEYLPKKESGDGDMTSMFAGRKPGAQATNEEKESAKAIAAQLNCNLSLTRLKLEDWEGVSCVNLSFHNSYK